MPTFCVPDLSGVPGSSGQFDWWSLPPDPAQIRFFPDNPDWLGAFSLSEGSGADVDMQFRALKGTLAGQQYLFLSWVIRVSAVDPTINLVNLVLGDGTGPGANYVALQAKLNSASSQLAGTQNGLVYTYRLYKCDNSAGTLTVSTTVSPALDGAALETTGRMWVNVVSPGRGLTTKWAFQVAIPLGIAWTPTALNLPTSGAFKLWYEVVASTPASMPVRYSMQPPPGSPPTVTRLNTTGFLEIVPTGLTVGHLLDMSTGATGCTSGVTIPYSGVGVRNVAATDPARPDQYTIRLDLGQVFPPNMANPAENPPSGNLYNIALTPNVTNTKFQNQFFAQPDVTGLTAAQQNVIHARFSLANWGSQLATPTASSWRPVPGGEDVLYKDTQGEAHFVWPLVADSYTTTLVKNIKDYLNHVWNGTLALVPDAQNPHQCMLAELFSTDSTVVITRSSIYVNMNVTSASIAREPARISIEGLTPIGAQPRDVYLFLQTFNMPQVAKSSDQGSVERTFDTRRLAALRGPQTGASEGEGQQGYEIGDIAAFFPTYIVHVYHDTGKKYTLESGRQVPVLEPQTAFGYFVVHQGSLYGWETRLYGAEKIAENFYRLRVPNNGAAYVEPAIQARESAADAPLPPDGLPGGTGRCRRLIAWLESKGPIGWFIALFVRLICWLLGG